MFINFFRISSESSWEMPTLRVLKRHTLGVAELLTIDAVGQAVIDLVIRDGADSVTARSLASSLHVSVGALYNYAGSMQEAVAAGERNVGAMVDALIASAPDQPLAALIDWAKTNPGLADFWFDAARVHLPLSERSRQVFATAMDLPEIPIMHFEAFRCLVGIELRGETPATNLDAISAWAPFAFHLLHRGHQMVEQGHAMADPPPHDLADGALWAEAERQTTDNGAEPKRAKVRFESAKLLLSTGTEQWNFRSLSEACGIPLAALHSLGSRSAHLRQAVVDLMVTMLELGQETNTDRVEAIAAVAFLTVEHCPTILRDMAEVLDSRSITQVRERTTVRSVIHDEALRQFAAPLMGLGNALMISAYLRREENPQAWSQAAPLAATMVRQAAAGTAHA